MVGRSGGARVSVLFVGGIWGGAIRHHKRSRNSSTCCALAAQRAEFCIRHLHLLCVLTTKHTCKQDKQGKLLFFRESASFFDLQCRGEHRRGSIPQDIAAGSSSFRSYVVSIMQRQLKPTS